MDLAAGHVAAHIAAHVADKAVAAVAAAAFAINLECATNFPRQ